MSWRPEKEFTGKEIQIVKHIRTCSISLIKKGKFKQAIIFLSRLRFAKIKMSDNSWLAGCGGNRHFHIRWVGTKSDTISLEGNCESLSKYDIPMSFSPAIVLPVSYPQSQINVSSCCVQCVPVTILNASHTLIHLICTVTGRCCVTSSPFYWWGN